MPSQSPMRKRTQKLMTLNFSRIPLLTLSLLSILPLLFISGNPKLWCLVNIIVLTFFFIWTYSVTKKLIEKNKYDAEIKFVQFRLQIVLTNIYIIALSIYFALTYPNIEDPKWMLLILIIGQCFLAWNYFYLIRFVAKTIATIELKRKCHLADYLGNMIFLIFFPIGIWWLHPKIQTLIEL